MKNVYYPIHFSLRFKKQNKKNNLPRQICQSLVMSNHFFFYWHKTTYAASSEFLFNLKKNLRLKYCIMVTMTTQAKLH